MTTQLIEPPGTMPRTFLDFPLEEDLDALRANVHADRVEEVFGSWREAQLAQARGQHGGAAMHIARVRW